MNKILIILSSLLLCAFASYADNALTLSSASGHPGDTVEIALSLENTDGIVAIQLDIPLGTSLSYIAGSCVHTGRTNGHDLTASVVNGTLKIITYSLSLSPYTGNSGEVLRFKLKLGNQPGTIVLEPSQAVVSAANGNSLEASVNNGSVTLLTPEIQVNTPLIDFGHIPIRSTYNRSISITNAGNEPLTISEVIFSNDRFTSDFSATTIPAGGSGSITVNYAPIDEGAVSEHVTIVSNSITGSQNVSLVADPFAVNELHVVPVSGYSDSTVTVALTMNNMSEISGMQCKFKMPSALEYVDGSFALSQRAVDHQSWAGMSNDTLTLIAFSLLNAIFSGSEDTIATFRVNLVGTYGNYRLTPLEPILSNVDGVNKLSASYYANVTIRSPRISCASTLDMGSSSVTETVVKQFSVRNNGNAPLRIDNVMFDQLGFAVQNELPLVIEQYQTVNLDVAYSREMEGNYSANMQIQSNDPSYGVYNVTVSGSRFEPNCMTIVADAYECYENVTLTFDMDNYTDITAVQFDFSYPYSQYVVNQSDIGAGDRVNGHSLTTYALNDSVYRVMLFSMQNDVFGGHSGSLISVTMHPVDSLATGTYSASASGVVLSDVSGINKFSCDDPSVTFATVCPVDSTAITHVMCEGEAYEFLGLQLVETGIYVDTLQNMHGCDSIITLNLTVNQVSTSIFEHTACDSYEWVDGITYTESTDEPTYTYTNVYGCDSVVTLHLTINHSNTGIDTQTACDNYVWIDGETYTESTNEPTFTFTNAAGCDSVVTLHLTITHSNEGVDEQSACDSFEWINGVVYTESTTTPTYILTNAEGCDSVVTLHLTINHSYSTEFSVSTSEPYTWNGVVYTETGDYVQTFVAVGGCDSIVTLHLVFENSLQLHSEGTISYEDVVVFADVNNIDDIAAVQFDFTYPNGDYLIENSDYVLTERGNGLSITVSQLNDSTSRVVVFSMQNTLITGHSGALVMITMHPYETTTAGTYIVHAENIVLSNIQSDNVNQGVNPYLAITTECPAYNTDINQTICEGEAYQFYGQNYMMTGIYVQTFQNIHGCDSTITLNLTVIPREMHEYDIAACDEYVWNGNTYYDSGNYFQSFPTEACDSIVIIHLTINHSSTSEIYDTTDALSYVWNDSTYSVSGDYIQTFTMANGCDSVVTLHLHFTQVGVETWTGIETSVYPNPASADLFVVSDEQISYVELFSVAGELIFQNDVYGNKAVCNVEGLVPGLYFVRVHYAGTGYSANYKFIKE